MLNKVAIANMNFGEYDAFDENQTDEDFFSKSFVMPFSFQMSTLNNKRNFIIVGKKGAGKTAAQLYLMKTLENDGYITNFFSFFGDVSHENYKDLAKTQKIDFLNLEIEKLKNIFNYYDFRPVWERVFYVQLSACLERAGISNGFTSFVRSSYNNTPSGILNGILKSTKVELKAPVASFSAKMSFDLSKLVNDKNEIDLADFNAASRDLLINHCAGVRVYMFVDELVFSKLDSQDDEVKVRSALIRDILRVAHELNRVLCREGMDIHFVYTLRPEIRNFLNELDAEIRKIVDSKDVLLHWNSEKIDDHILIELFKNKILFGANGEIDLSGFIDQTISFSGRGQSIFKFILHNSWYRPRDIVRYLKSYQKINPDHTRLTEDGFKKSLNEYSRVSAKEIMDELSVGYGASVVSRIKLLIKKQEYRGFDDLARCLTGIPGVNIDQLCDDMFFAGIIGNISGGQGKKRFFWSHRGEEFLSKNMGIYVHPGLWNYFNIRHS